MCSSDLTMIPGAKLDGGDPPYHEPMVAPGTYTVRLKVDGHSETTTLNVLPDPRIKMSDEDYIAEYNRLVSLLTEDN